MIDHQNPATWPEWMRNDTRLAGKLSDLEETPKEGTDA